METKHRVTNNNLNHVSSFPEEVSTPFNHFYRKIAKQNIYHYLQSHFNSDALIEKAMQIYGDDVRLFL